MPVSSTLASQELLRPSPKSCSPCKVFSANEGGTSVPQGILTAAFQCRSSFTVHWWHPVVIGRRGTLTSGGCLHVRDSGRTLTVWSLISEEAREVLGSGLSLYTQWWSHHPVICIVTLGLACLHISHHLRFCLLAYQPVILQLVSKS
jgi:hypothetical protein